MKKNVLPFWDSDIPYNFVCPTWCFYDQALYLSGVTYQACPLGQWTQIGSAPLFGFILQSTSNPQLQGVLARAVKKGIITHEQHPQTALVK